MRPDRYYKPHISLSPIKLVADYQFGDNTSAIELLSVILKGSVTDTYLTMSGRAALRLTISGQNLKENDEVCVMTTSNNFYVSGCVSSVIEERNLFSRQISDKTRLIILVHEFGFLIDPEEIVRIRALGIPIVHDFAYSFLSYRNIEGSYLENDSCIFSFPKVFNMQFGGALLTPIDVSSYYLKPNQNEYDYLTSHLTRNLDNANLMQIQAQQLEAYSYLLGHLENQYISEYRPGGADASIPSVVMLQIDSRCNILKLRELVENHGIECTVFYGLNVFIIPAHHNLTKIELDYIVGVVEYCVEDLIIGSSYEL